MADNQLGAMISLMETSLGWGEPNKVHTWYGKRNGAYFAHGSTPWCNMLITWAAYMSGNYTAVCHGTDYAYTVYHAKRFRAEGEWHYGHKGIERGDIVFFQWEGGSANIDKVDHVGIVVNVTSTSISTIEGNVENKSVRKSRTRNSSIAGYGRPKYAVDQVVARPQPKPKPVPKPKPKAKTVLPVPKGIPFLRKGSTGTRVKQLQKALNADVKAGLAIDGDFGPKTDGGVRKLQRAAKLADDGIYGPKSESALRKRLASKGK